MKPGLKLGAYALALAAALGVGAAVGTAVGPIDVGDDSPVEHTTTTVDGGSHAGDHGFGDH